jgi:hypothetical protein
MLKVEKMEQTLQGFVLLGECYVCKHLKSDNRILSPCRHSLCFDCLHRLIEDNNLQCPECKQIFEINGEANSFGNDLRKDSLVDLLNALPFPKDLAKEVLMCESCSTNAATVWCDHCKVSYCDVDDKFVHKPKVLQAHRRMPIEQKPITEGCVAHNQIIEDFCVDCKEVICFGNLHCCSTVCRMLQI